MKAGKLQHRVTIQEDRSTTKDNIGANVPNWSDVLTTWASIEPLSGRDVILGAQISPDTTHKITIRYRPGVHSAMRFKWLIPVPKYFNILGPPLDTETQARELVCMCKEVETVSARY